MTSAHTGDSPSTSSSENTEEQRRELRTWWSWILSVWAVAVAPPDVSRQSWVRRTSAQTRRHSQSTDALTSSRRRNYESIKSQYFSKNVERKKQIKKTIVIAMERWSQKCHCNILLYFSVVQYTHRHIHTAHCVFQCKQSTVR